MTYSTARKKLTKIGVDVMPIKKDEVDQYWGLLKFMIIKGLDHSGNLLTEAELKDEIKQGFHQLFITFGS